MPNDSLLWTPPAKVSQTAAADTASSSRSITDCSIADQKAPSSEPAPPAPRMSQENDPMELRRLWCAAMALQDWSQQAHSELSDYRLKEQITGSCKLISLSSTATGFFLCFTHSRQGLVLFSLAPRDKIYICYCVFNFLAFFQNDSLSQLYSPVQTWKSLGHVLTQLHQLIQRQNLAQFYREVSLVSQLPSKSSGMLIHRQILLWYNTYMVFPLARNKTELLQTHCASVV